MKSHAFIRTNIPRVISQGKFSQRHHFICRPSSCLFLVWKAWPRTLILMHNRSAKTLSKGVDISPSKVKLEDCCEPRYNISVSFSRPLWINGRFKLVVCEQNGVTSTTTVLTTSLMAGVRISRNICISCSHQLSSIKIIIQGKYSILFFHNYLDVQILVNSTLCWYFPITSP